jgi:hypothetical protein
MPTWAATEPLAGTLTLEQPTEPLAPGAEKTRQAGHYATLMAQVAQMTAVGAGLNAPKARPGGTSPAALVTRVVIAAGVLVIALIIALLIRRKKQKQEGIHGN